MLQLDENSPLRNTLLMKGGLSLIFEGIGMENAEGMLFVFPLREVIKLLLLHLLKDLSYTCCPFETNLFLEPGPGSAIMCCIAHRSIWFELMAQSCFFT